MIILRWCKLRWIFRPMKITSWFYAELKEVLIMGWITGLIWGRSERLSLSQKPKQSLRSNILGRLRLSTLSIRMIRMSLYSTSKINASRPRLYTLNSSLHRETYRFKVSHTLPHPSPLTYLPGKVLTNSLGLSMRVSNANSPSSARPSSRNDL